jgi:anti-sigma B factor antagonist
MDEATHLHLAAREINGTVVITVAGEVDLASATALAEALDRATSTGAEAVILDLRRLEFMDSTGISVLVKAHQASVRSGCRFAVVRGSPQVDRVLSLTGLDEQMTLIDTPEELLQGSEQHL